MRALFLIPLFACRGDKAPGTSPSPEDTGDTAPPADSGDPGPLLLTLSAEDGRDGEVRITLLPADGGAPLAFTTALGEVAIDAPPGDYGLLAWRDDDGDGAWDGIWADSPEPAARIGLRLPRAPLALPLRSSLPAPVLEQSPELVALYEAAWAIAAEHIGRGDADNGFADAWMDEAFSEQIFQWDTCFMALFGLHGLDSFPVMSSLDNFYGTQDSDGYICRVVNEADGQPGGDASDPSEPMLNPPLFATAELAYVRRTGDRARLSWVIPALDAYADWIDAHVRTASGLYYTSMLGSGMDNAPRDAAYEGWVDLTAQQALARRDLSALAALAGDEAEASAQQAEADRICADVAARFWDAEVGWFFDLDYEGDLLQEKNLAGIWPLVAGCADPDQAAAVIDWLAEPSAFWRVHPFASTAADAPSYDPDGDYWRGGVWAPTSYMSEIALLNYGRRDLARQAAERQLENLVSVYADFAPQPGQLAPDATGDGLQTLWELYAPDARAPGTRWDGTYLGRQDFVGWTGLIPIAGLMELILGLEPDGPEDRLVWHLRRTDRHGVQGYRFGDQLVSLIAEARAGADEAGTLRVESSDAFTLVVEVAGVEQEFAVPAGESSFSLDAPDTARAASLVPAGPFPGYAILGNGQISAVYSTADGTSDPPGVRHLYAGDHGLDLLELGQTLVGQSGARVSQWRSGLDPFFAAYAEVPLPDGASLVWRAFAAADAPALVIDGALVSAGAATRAVVAPLIQLREDLDLDGAVALASLSREGEILVATRSDGRALALGLSPAPEHWELGQVVADPVAGGLRDRAGDGTQLALSRSLEAAAGEQAPFRQVIALGDSAAEAAALAETLLEDADPLGAAAAAWADLAPGALCSGPRCAVASANLAAAAASVLGGAVPADLTGQFVTNSYPQLYPRDAAMVARALLAAGREADALAIVRYWLDPAVEGPGPGEWYARYDARGRGVDAGSGAAFDTPEWDFNAYLALLVEALGAEALSGAERARLLEGLDFLVATQDSEGLWTEGGIVEWEGRLASTTMIAWAGLDAGARLADDWGEAARAADYRRAAGLARAGLFSLVDEVEPVLGDERDGAVSWDTSLLFGPVLGYPADPLLDLSFTWILDEARAHGGGVRYFEDPAGGTGSYGTDLFFFTTAASAWYALSTGDPEAEALLDWMAAMTSRYGLAPERVYSDGSGAAAASPLSWCAAELALRLIDAEQLPDTPDVDGWIQAPEYRAAGFSVLDHDGVADEAGSLVAMYAQTEAGTLNVALRLAGPAGADGRTWVWLSGADGLGAWETGEAGDPLLFRAAPEETPGAVAVVEVDLAAGTCTLHDATGGRADCSSFAAGTHGVELAVELAHAGLDAPVQLIAEREGDAGATLPASGSLSTAGPEERVRVRFEVDASALGPLGAAGVTLSGDRAELGAWAGDAVALTDQGDGTWAVTVSLERGGWIAYKYLVGTAGDGSWDGVEFDGDNRSLRVEDLDGTGRVSVVDRFGVRGGVLGDR